ncbi:helix-turn-helix domain-containing protein [Intrasporangium sp.]|uniref:helix-turn-helix domain-containing protein n=1 Tax=Intrasporangium sp. TaxID=1925024 RepID=UPI0032213B75
MSDSSRGLLFPGRLPTFRRVPAPGPVAHLVRWFWIPEWDLPHGRTSRQEVVAYPASNLVVEPHLVGLAGPTTRVSHRDLTGHGWAVGALLRPAAVPALLVDPAAARDRYLPLDLPDLHAAVADVMRGPDTADRPARAVAAFAGWLLARAPETGEDARLANSLADLADTDRTVLRVEDLAEALGVSTRTVQRLARRYVGMPPAAMIRRRRLQEAAERIRAEPDTDLAAIAADLGYADQAHLTNDFRAVLGHTPGRYRAESR